MCFQLAKDGAAEKDGRLKVGHRILEVNSVSLLGATHQVAVRALRSNTMEVSLLVCHGYDPEEVLRMKAEQEKLGNITAPMGTPSSISSDSKPLVLFPTIFLSYIIKF